MGRMMWMAALGPMWLALVACGSDSSDTGAPGNMPDAPGMGGTNGLGQPPVTAQGGGGTQASPRPNDEMGPDPVLQMPMDPVVPPDDGEEMPMEPPPEMSCDVPPPASELIGWATEGSGTTGGGDVAPVVVTNEDEFRDAIQGAAARVIHLRGSIEGTFSIGSNKTIIGLCGARITGHIGFSNVSNSILRNLNVVGLNCTDSPQDCSGGDDAITVGDGSDHIWIDHLHVSDGSDGNLDITSGADFVTVSWTKFDYSTRRTDPLAGATGHRFSNLIGSSDTDARDPTHLNVTYHHCWWGDNVDQRMPRTRRGQIHVFNNLYTAAGNSYCTSSGFEAQLLVQNNVYVGVNRPLEQRDGGDMLEEGNLFQNTNGNAAAMGDGFDPPYDFALDAAAGLEAAIRAGAGPQ